MTWYDVLIWIVDILVALLLKYFCDTAFTTSVLKTSTSPMATPNTPSLSPDAVNPNDVDFHKLRLYIEEHFRGLPDSMKLLSRNLESQSICPHYLRYRICPSLFTNQQCSATYHPEFILRDNCISWMPRTWICRALQRHLANEGPTHCPITACPYSHAGNWAAAEQLAFRALALRTQSYNLGLLWYEQPEDSGCRPSTRSAHHQHCESYKHNLSLLRSNGHITYTKKTSHHHLLMDQISQKSVSFPRHNPIADPLHPEGTDQSHQSAGNITTDLRLLSLTSHDLTHHQPEPQIQHQHSDLTHPTETRSASQQHAKHPWHNVTSTAMIPGQNHSRRTATASSTLQLRSHSTGPCLGQPHKTPKSRSSRNCASWSTHRSTSR